MTTTPPIKHYGKIEEQLNVMSHGLGFVLSLVGAYFLVKKGLGLGSALHLWSYVAYASSLLLLYFASTAYHYAKKDARRQRLKVFDHAAIYVLIAGTYVPYALIGIGGVWGCFIFGVIVTIALVGVVFKLFFTGRFSLVSTISYVLMGSLVLVAIKPLTDNMPAEALSYIFIGGAFYIVGAVLYTLKKIPYNHAIFHFFVLAGSVSHYLGILWYV